MTKHECPHCSKPFGSAQGLNVHIHRMHKALKREGSIESNNNDLSNMSLEELRRAHSELLRKFSSLKAAYSRMLIEY